MTNTPGADPRQSRTLQTLDRFSPDGITALAAAALLLLDAINNAALIVNDQTAPALANRTHALVEALYRLQDCLHGSDTGLPEALFAMLRAVEDVAVDSDGQTDEVALSSPAVRQTVAFSVPVELPADEALEMAAMFLEVAIVTAVETAGAVPERQVRTAKAFVDQAIRDIARTSAARLAMSCPAKGGVQ